MPQEVSPQASVANPPETDDRRKHRRHPGKAVAHVVRGCDPVRTRIPAKVFEISVAGIGLVCSARIETNEQVVVCLQNDIQRYAKDVRGIVRWMSPMAKGEFRLGIELSVPLSHNDLMSVTRMGTAWEMGTAKIWM